MPAAKPARDRDLERHIRTAVEQELRDAGAPGAAIALVVDGEEVLTDAIGPANLNGMTGLQSDAQCYVYSITKTLIAIAALQLVERRSIALDEPVQTYLPTLALGRPVTVRQLLNHTGGLPDYGGMPVYQTAVRHHPRHPWSPGEFLERTNVQDLLFEPGCGWAYSNVGYLILRMMLERLHDRPLRDVLDGNIVAPLGLEQTFVAETLQDARTLTPGFSAIFSDDGTLADVAALYHPGWVSHGVVISTARELARIFEALFADRLVGPEILAAMLDPVIVPHEHPLFGQPGYGLGLMIDAGSPHGVVAGHTGEGPGYSVAALHVSTAAGCRLTSVALANRDVDDLGLRIAFHNALRVLRWRA